MIDLSVDGRSLQTAAGIRWRTMLDAARGQALRPGDPEWTGATDPYADRVDSFRAGRRTDQNVLDFLADPRLTELAPVPVFWKSERGRVA